MKSAYAVVISGLLVVGSGLPQTSAFNGLDMNMGTLMRRSDAAYFHAQFRRVNPLPYKSDYTILDGVKGQGHYVGT